jgi:hypothetical protein
MRAKSQVPSTKLQTSPRLPKLCFALRAGKIKMFKILNALIKSGIVLDLEF